MDDSIIRLDLDYLELTMTAGASCSYLPSDMTDKEIVYFLSLARHTRSIVYDAAINSDEHPVDSMGITAPVELQSVANAG